MIILGIVAIGLGVLFENKTSPLWWDWLSIAASCNFPIILLSMYWKRLTTRGALAGGWLGLLTAVILMILGPTIWVNILGHEKRFIRMNIRHFSQCLLPLLRPGWCL